MAETWRVVDASGREQDVSLFRTDFGFAWGAGGMFDGYSGATPRAAIRAWAEGEGVDAREILAPGEPTRAELLAQLAAVTAERDVLRAQQAPLLDAHDAMVAAARAAGWTGAGATAAELVAWVRRGEREACARIADDEARDSEGNEGAVCAAQSIAAKIRGRNGDGT